MHVDLISAGCKDFGTSHDLQCGQAQGGVRRCGAAEQQAASSFPQSLHSDPLRLHGEPDAGRERSHDQRAAAQLAVDAAEGRRGGRVEGGDYRQQQQRRGEGDDAAVLSYNPYFSDSQNIVFACFFAKLTRCIASSAAPTSCRSWPQVSDTTSSPESCRWYVVRRCLHSNSNYNQPE